MSTFQPLSDSESKLLEEYRTEHPKQLPWQFSLQWLLWLTTCVALLAALVARTNMAVGFLLLLAFGTAVTTRRLSRQRKRAMQEIREEVESKADADQVLAKELERFSDPRVRNLIASLTNDNTAENLFAAWFGTATAGMLYPPVILSLTILMEPRPAGFLGAAVCSAIGGFLVTSFLAAIVMVAAGMLLKLSGFRGSHFAIGSLVGGGTGLISIGLLYSELANSSREYYMATALAVLMGQVGGVWAVRKQARQTTHRILKPPTNSQPQNFRLRQLFMVTTLVAVLSALVSQLNLSEAQVTVCLSGTAWLGVTIIGERLLAGNSRST